MEFFHPPQLQVLELDPSSTAALSAPDKALYFNLPDSV